MLYIYDQYQKMQTESRSLVAYDEKLNIKTTLDARGYFQFHSLLSLQYNDAAIYCIFRLHNQKHSTESFTTEGIK